MKNRFFIILSSLILVSSCVTEHEEQAPLAERVVEETYKKSGADKVENATVSFLFRDRFYEAKRNDGYYSLKRTFQDSLGEITDELNNDGFRRFLDGKEIPVPDSMAVRYSESVNSVHYFSVLPFGLKDKAVNLQYLDSVKLNDGEYHKIQVSFDKEGGGVDYEDIFIYWINTQTKFIDFLAYKYSTDGGGMRFREAYNPRTIMGIRFVDYRNYKPKDSTLKLMDVDRAFQNGEVNLLSTIELENITIN